MFREATPYGCLQLSRREWFAALAVIVTPTSVTAQEPTAFEVKGIVTSGDLDGGIFDIGHEFALHAPPHTPTHPHLVKCLHHQVRVRVEPI